METTHSGFHHHYNLIITYFSFFLTEEEMKDDKSKISQGCQSHESES